ncbi:unnamed protein product, partial [Meganyctiphanes norvegica]
NCHQPFPLEYYLNVDVKIRREIFYKNVKRGDLLCGRILSHRSSGHYYINIFAAVGDGKRKDLVDCDVVAHMKSDDTHPEIEKSNSYGNWKINTELFLEVLEVINHGDGPRLHVGTKGITLNRYQIKK